MSHQTGIKANDSLKAFFGKLSENDVRALKISIENEELCLDSHEKVVSTWEKDYDKIVLPMIEESQPCYIIYRFDSKNACGYEWLFISWCPDSSTVRQKMLYASTKATLKTEFGSSNIKEEIHGTVTGDVSFNGYLKHKTAEKAPAPLTMREEELQEIKKSEVNTEFSVDSRHQTLGGVAFPMTEETKQAIIDMGRSSYNYLQFKIDLEKEIINLSFAGNVQLEKLPSKVPSDAARYHLYNFKHTHEGDYLESIVFIYSMPGYKCSVKERMLYSSCKGHLTETISSLGIDIAKKMEIDSGNELTEEYLQDELHPKICLHRPKFAKPKGPPNRGAKRLTKPQAEN